MVSLTSCIRQISEAFSVASMSKPITSDFLLLGSVRYNYIVRSQKRKPNCVNLAKFKCAYKSYYFRSFVPVISLKTQ